MYNAEKLATLCTQDTGLRKTKQKHNTENQTDEQHNPTKNRVVNPGACEGQAVIRHPQCY